MADPEQLLASMSAAQIAGWAAFAELEPFGPLRDDQRAAHVACAVVNAIPFRGRGAKSLRPADVFSSLGIPFKPQSQTQMAEYAKSRTLAMGGEVKTIKKDVPHGGKARRPRNRRRG